VLMIIAMMAAATVLLFMLTPLGWTLSYIAHAAVRMVPVWSRSLRNIN